MRSLVVFYSLTGNTRFVAEAVTEAAGADVLELKPKHDIQAKGFMKFFWGGAQALSAKQPELEVLTHKPEDYDLVFIGTPVWAGSHAPALRSFFAGVTLEGKQVALFCCHGGGKGRVFAKMRAAMPGSVVVGELDLCEPLRKDSEAAAERAREWARGGVTCVG